MEVDTAPPACDPQQVEGLWFEDGNLVLTAGNSQYLPPDSELVEGCPLVRIPDPATEVTAFLKAIFDPEFFMPFLSLTTLDSIVGCLRLSHKYRVVYLRRCALVHLSSGYRTTLLEWDSHDYGDDDDPPLNRYPSEILSWLYPDHTAFMYIIQLAREVDALWVLPLVFYSLAANSTGFGNEIFNGEFTTAFRLAFPSKQGDTGI
ncbi:hypothetical protein C8R44DRAFT_878675 [Mycena epipterygia]|nr:hypothetical protein C8R44DRAFT_878675 [Mycena epipterygia]